MLLLLLLLKLLVLLSEVLLKVALRVLVKLGMLIARLEIVVGRLLVMLLKDDVLVGRIEMNHEIVVLEVLVLAHADVLLELELDWVDREDVLVAVNKGCELEESSLELEEVGLELEDNRLELEAIDLELEDVGLEIEVDLVPKELALGLEELGLRLEETGLELEDTTLEVVDVRRGLTDVVVVVNPSAKTEKSLLSLVVKGVEDDLEFAELVALRDVVDTLGRGREDMILPLLLPLLIDGCCDDDQDLELLLGMEVQTDDLVLLVMVLLLRELLCVVVLWLGLGDETEMVVLDEVDWYSDIVVCTVSNRLHFAD